MNVVRGSLWALFTDILFGFAGLAAFFWMTETLDQKLRHARAITADSIQLVVVVDATGSMAEELDELNRAIVSLAEILPTTTRELQIGIIAYRSSPHIVRPLSALKLATEDQGESLTEFRRQVTTLAASPSIANIPRAVSEGCQMLKQPGGRQVLMIIGDVDCSEIAQAAKQPQLSLERELCDEISHWCEVSQSDRRVVCFFVPDTSPIPGEENHLFRSLANASRDGAYCAEPAAMMKEILIAALGGDLSQ